MNSCHFSQRRFLRREPSRTNQESIRFVDCTLMRNPPSFISPPFHMSTFLRGPVSHQADLSSDIFCQSLVAVHHSRAQIYLLANSVPVPRNDSTQKEWLVMFKLVVRSFVLLFVALLTTSMATDSINREFSARNLPADPNPLLGEWAGPYGGVPPFDKVQISLFKPALEAGMAEQLAEIDRITTNPAPPGFETNIPD